MWGAKPRKITAHDTTADGTPKTSLLLASGAGQLPDMIRRMAPPALLLRQTWL